MIQVTQQAFTIRRNKQNEKRKTHFPISFPTTTDTCFSLLAMLISFLFVGHIDKKKAIASIGKNSNGLFFIDRISSHFWQSLNGLMFLQKKGPCNQANNRLSPLDSSIFAILKTQFEPINLQTPPHLHASLADDWNTTTRIIAQLFAHTSTVVHPTDFSIQEIQALPYTRNTCPQYHCTSKKDIRLQDQRLSTKFRKKIIRQL